MNLGAEPDLWEALTGEILVRYYCASNSMGTGEFATRKR